MCKVHDQVCGQESVELYVEARVLDNVCMARLAYLKRQALSFHTWLGTQEWCEDPTLFCKHIVERTERVLDRDADTCCDYLFKDNKLTTSELDDLEYDIYQQKLEDIAIKGARRANSDHAHMATLECRLEDYKEELALHDRIQDYIDTLPLYSREGMYKPVFRRLDAVKNNRALSYGGWVMFSNQLMEMMDKKQYTPKFEIRHIPEKIAMTEEWIANLNKKVIEKDNFFSDPHKEADEFIKQEELLVCNRD